MSERSVEMEGLTGHPTPKDLGYYFPAEFAPHTATWLSWPHKEASWPGKIASVYANYSRFVKVLAGSEKVNINVNDDVMEDFATSCLQQAGADLDKVSFFFIQPMMPGAAITVLPF